MSPRADAPLLAALRALPDAPPPVPEELLSRAFPDPAPRPNAAGPVLFAAAVALAASLPLWLSSPDDAQAWSDGLARRGLALGEGLLERLSR